MYVSRRKLSIIAFFTVVVSSALAGPHGAGDKESTEVPLYTDLGQHHHAITTSSPKAQAYFDQGLRLIYAFNHDEAILAFREALKYDPNCAMAYWGIAAAKGPNYNLGMDEERTKSSFEASQKAKSLESGVSEAERGYIDAMALRYSYDLKADRGALDRAYAAAMRANAEKYPADDDALTLYAESMMNLRPWQLWNKDGQPAEGTLEILRALETVLTRNPKHPGAIHYYIHATEASPNPEKAEPYAARLADLVPGAGHLVHMASHTYIRTGKYDEAAKLNVRAADIDRAYIAFRNPQGPYPLMYFPHNIHFIWACAAIEGKSRLATSAARGLARVVPAEVAKTMPMAEYFVPTIYYAHVRFGHWNEMLREPRPPQELQFTTGIWHYARGLSFAGLGAMKDARDEAAQLHQIQAAYPADHDINLNKGKVLLELAGLLLDGEIAQKSGDIPAAIAAFEKGVALDDALNYDEPPAWYQPVRLFLGAAQLQDKQPGQAEATYRQHLKRHPNDGWGLFGLEKSLTAQGKKRDARAVRKQFKAAWKRADVKLTASRF